MLYYIILIMFPIYDIHFQECTMTYAYKRRMWLIVSRNSPYPRPFIDQIYDLKKAYHSSIMTAPGGNPRVNKHVCIPRIHREYTWIVKLGFSNFPIEINFLKNTQKRGECHGHSLNYNTVIDHVNGT